jgi:gliding motility-associated-like protein
LDKQKIVLIFINMKKLYVVLALLMSFVSTASHLAGGDIQYRYIGDSTGITRHYKVILRVYRDVTGIAMPTTDQVTVSSGCYSDINIPMTLTPGSGVIAPTLFDCVIPGPTNKTLEVYMYVGYVILPGNCSTFRFWYENCCRPGNITNIFTSNGALGNDGFFFDALLDNATSGQNSSPVFTSEPVRAFCVGNPFSWKQTAIEEDGDSVIYSLINCRENVYPNQTNIPFDAGWSATQPVTSAYFNLNPATGLISFLPTQNEIDVLSVLVEEYRFDSLYQVWYKVGSASRDMMISISPNCNATAMQGVQYSPTTYPTDPITGFPYVEVACGDSAFTLKFHIKLDGTSINDVDFRMTNSNTNQPKAIKKLYSGLDANFETDSVRVVMFTQFNQAGDYYLYSKKGNDGNTLINKCGIPMDEFDTILVRVGPCPPAPPPPPPGDLELPEDRYGPEPRPRPQPPQLVIIPNVLTPNGDDKNDLFIIKNLMGWDNREIIIMNRWGKVVYTNLDYKNDWDGDKVADGVYFGVLNISEGNLQKQYSFNLTILR